MRALWLCAISAMTGLLLAGATPAAYAYQPSAPAHTKPSSFEPHARPPGNAYGTPIGDKILIKRVKKKKPATRPAHTGTRALPA